MKSNFLLILVSISFFLTITSCEKEKPIPVADFSYQGNDKIAPCEVTFQNSSTNASSYQWNFGDGTSSTEQNTKHTYTNGGNYNVLLIAKGEGGTDSVSKLISIPFPLSVPNFSFVASNNSYAPSAVTFTNLSTNIKSSLWVFGDGNSSNQKDPVHTYTEPGQYTVTLTVTNNDNKTATINQLVTIKKKDAPLPVPLFTYSGNTAFAPCFVTFNNTSSNAVSYQWAFGDGQTSTEKNPKHLYSNGGTYSVILTVKNSDGVPVSLTKQMTVKAAPTKIRIKQVTLQAYPLTNSGGGGWDSDFTGPDPYFIITNNSTAVVYYESAYFPDITQTQLPKSWPAANIDFPDITSTYKFSLYDYDGIWNPDVLGSITYKFNSFKPTDGTAYPTTITLDAITTNGIKVAFSVEWLP